MIDGAVLTSARWHDRFGARSATAIAKTDSALDPISKKDFVALVSRATTRNGRTLATSAEKRFYVTRVTSADNPSPYFWN
jgi:hypothetical protein